MARTRIIYLFWIALGAIGVILLIRHINESAYERVNVNVNANIQKEYQGVIIDKYVDRDDHQYKKVILNNGYVERTVLFDLEKSGIYDFFEIGDSIVKESGTLQIRVVRSDTDTILEMRY